MTERDPTESPYIDHYQRAREAKWGDLSYINLDGIEIPERFARKVLESYYTTELLRNTQRRFKRGMGAISDPKETEAMMDGEKIGMFKILHDLNMGEQEKAVSAKAYIDDLGEGAGNVKRS